MKPIKKILCIVTCLALMVGSFSFASFNSKAVERSGETYRSKKGLQVDIGTMSDAEDLGISEAFINVVFEQFLSLGDTGIHCSAGGHEYYINPDELNILDSAVKDLTDMGATVTIAFINQYKEGYEWLLYTGAKHEGTADYGFNIKEDHGKYAIAAVSQFIASRYNGGQYGKVSRYVIGNEVNDNTAYNWVGEQSINDYVGIYYNTFKIFYDALKAENNNALVYIPLEHMWNINNTSTSYAGRDFLKIFNKLAKADGVNWSLAFHAYSEPLCNPNPLRDGSPLKNEKNELVPAGIVSFDADTTVITMRNLEVLTNFMQTDEMKDANGNVRSIILSEQGFTSNSRTVGNNETLQAAAIAYAYYKAEFNPYIDAFILYSYIEPVLDNAYNTFGLRGRVGTSAVPSTAKTAYYVYKYLDTKDSLSVSNFALSTLGIEDWRYVISGFDASRFNSMKSIDNGSFYSVSSMDSAAGRTVLSEGMASAPWDNVNGGITGVFDIYWNPGYYVHTISGFDYDPNCQHRPLCVAVADKDVYATSAQTVYHDFETPLDLTGAPYLGFMIGFDERNEASETLNVRMRVYSGPHIYDVNTTVPSGNYYLDGTAYNLFADLSSWSYRNSIDRVAIWISESDKNVSFDGTFFVYNFSSATGLSGSEPKAIGKDTSKPNVTPYPYETQPWAYKWGDKDLSEEFNFTTYYNENPSLQTTLGMSPVLLIEDYAKKNVPTTEYKDMHRLYNSNTGEHFYTVDENEYHVLVNSGWKDEGIGWKTPVWSKTPVYRLYNYNSGEHHYTTQWNEVYTLYTTASGNNTGEDIKQSAWDYEGIGWYSDDLEFTPLYRLYNPNAKGNLEPGSHHYTKDPVEKSVLLASGWRDEGIGWYGGK